MNQGLRFYLFLILKSIIIIIIIFIIYYYFEKVLRGQFSGSLHETCL